VRAIDPIGPRRTDVSAVEPIPRRAPDGRRERRSDDELDHEDRRGAAEPPAPDPEAVRASETKPPRDGLHVDVRA
jgi:hypothetical protein